MAIRQGTSAHEPSGGGAKIGSPGEAEAAPSAACISDVGRSRDHNEDCFGEDADLGLWVVADGMGGHLAGEVASDLAVSRIFRLVADGTSVADAVSSTHDFIRSAPSQGIGSQGMGTTVVVAQLIGSSYRVCWVGDSRAYLHGADGLKRITVDHSYVQQLVDSGVITAEDAAAHPERNVVTQCLGADGIPAVKVGETVGELNDGDVLLLCTDGLTGEVGEDNIAAVLREEKTLAEKAQRLVDAANANGGSDNVTVALIPARAAAPHTPDAARTREIPAMAAGHLHAANGRRRAVWWTSVAAGIAVILTAAWFWRAQIVELVPALMRYGEAADPAPGTGAAAPPALSAPQAAQDETNDGERDSGTAQELQPGQPGDARPPN